MSREQSEVLTAVTSEMDKRENKFLKWLLGGLLVMILSLATASYVLGAKIQDAQNKLNSLITAHEVVTAETDARVQEWSAWRRSVEDGNLRSMGDRFTAADWDVAASIFNMSSPPVLLPFSRDIHQRSRTP